MNDPILSPEFLYDSRLTHERIRRLQRILRTLHFGPSPGIPLAENGMYDDATRSALRAFQTDAGLPPTGEVNLPTWEALRLRYEAAEREAAPPAPIRPFATTRHLPLPGEEGDSVLLLQLLLHTLILEYDTLPLLPLSGRYDEETADALREFRLIHRMEEGEGLDIPLWERLAEEYNRLAAKSP